MLINPARILIIRPSALGDVARSVGVLYSLRRAYPAAQIDWLVQDSFADVIAAHPDLSGVVPFPRASFSRWMRTGRVDRVLGFLSSLRARRYDLVLDCQGLARSGLFARATGAPVRVGHANARELGWLGVNVRVPGSIEAHSVDRMLSLLTPLGVVAHAGERAMRLYTPAEGAQWAGGHPMLMERYALLAPTSRWPAKQWPADRFAQLAKALLDQGVRVVLVGAASERAQVAPLLDLAQSNDRVLDLIGKTSLAHLMGVIERAALVVANDSAALHIAVGFNRPLVALYGPTRVHRVGPYRRERDVIQRVSPGDVFDHKSPASVAMMQRISADEVIRAAIHRLKQ